MVRRRYNKQGQYDNTYIVGMGEWRCQFKSGVNSACDMCDR